LDLLRHVDLGSILIQFPVLVFSLCIHEASHAWMADRLGDYTARYLGRVSLNPVVHSDPIGTIVFPLLQFFTNLPLIGWAKPVPVNPSHLRRPARDQILVSLAGPGANLLAAVVSFIILAGLKLLSSPAAGLLTSMAETMRVPRYPSLLTPLLGILFFSLVINLALALFNLLPIPPLDGHWVLRGVLPDSAGRALDGLSTYGFLILYGLAFLGLLRFVFVPVRWARALLLSV